MIRKGFVLLVVLCSLLLAPVTTSARTIADYEKELAKFEKEKAESEKAVNKTQDQINATNKEIANLKNEVLSLSKEVSNLNEEIETYNLKIKEKVLASKQIIEYLELSSGSNFYLDYVLNSENVEELIYRSAVVKELIDYNERSIAEMQNIVDGNKERQKKIDARNEEIREKEKQLESKVVSLGEEKSSLVEGGVNAETQIKQYKELIDSYKKKGCKTNDVIGVDCAVSGPTGVFRRPIKTGYITQEAYYSKSYTHRGLDMSSYNKTKEKIYPTANGTIVAKYIDPYGALVIIMEHHITSTDQWYTSLYAHMSSYAPNLYVGKYLTSDQYLGYMGTTGHSTGVHLHFELIPCRYLSGSCYSWNAYYNYAINQFKKGYKGPRGLITFPKGLYNSWNSR